MIQIIAAGIALITLIFILLEKMHRAIIAMVGASIMVLAGLIFGFFNEQQAVAAIEFDALGLLLGMMIIVSILEPTGLFQYVAIKAGQLSRGNPVHLLIFLSVGTALISMVISNVTTVVLVGPLTVLIAELLGFSPVPFLMAEAILSVTSAIGTSIGDPASLLVSIASGNSFIDFLTHALPIVVIAGVITLIMLRLLFAKELSQSPIDPEVVDSLDAQEALEDRKTAKKTLFLLFIAIVLFIIQETIHLSTGYIALFAAALTLLWVNPDLNQVLGRIDWSVPFFFTGLFVIIGGLDKAGVFEPLIAWLSPIGHENPMLLGVIIIWVVAGLSALIDNIPVTIAMISLLIGLQNNGVDVSALWWAVVFGAGFGGSATSIGSSTNIVVVSLSERTHSPITSKLWAQKGLPIAIATCIVGSILFVLAYPWLGN